MPGDKVRNCIMIGPEGAETADFHVYRREKKVKVTFYQNFVKVRYFTIDYSVALKMQTLLTLDGWYAVTSQHGSNYEF